MRFPKGLFGQISPRKCALILLKCLPTKGRGWERGAELCSSCVRMYTMFVYICTAWSNIGVCLLVTPDASGKNAGTLLWGLYSVSAGKDLRSPGICSRRPFERYIAAKKKKKSGTHSMRHRGPMFAIISATLLHVYKRRHN